MLNQTSYVQEEAMSSSANNTRNRINRLERIRRKLMTAVTIGNLFGRPVQLVYKDHYERFTLKEAIVVAVTDRFAVLQGGRSIAQTRIRKVIF